MLRHPMMRRSAAVVFSGNSVAEAPAPREDLPPSARPSYVGELADFFSDRPTFRTAMRGYDRLQVDNYLAWMESELSAARRETDDLMTRYGQCSAELELSRRLLAQSPEAQELTRTSDRMGQMLRLAAEEAAAMRSVGAAEAERIVADARLEADARLRKAHEIKQLAVAASDQLRTEAARLRREAAEELERARAEARETARRIEEQRRAAEAAVVEAASTKAAALRAELDELQLRRAGTLQSLRELTHQVDDLLGALSEAPSAAPAPAVELVAVPESERAAS